MLCIIVVKYWPILPIYAGIIVCMRPANGRRRYIVTSSPIGWAHTQNNPCIRQGFFTAPGAFMRTSNVTLKNMGKRIPWINL